MKGRIHLAALSALALAGCATAPQRKASGDVSGETPEVPLSPKAQASFFLIVVIVAGALATFASTSHFN